MHIEEEHKSMIIDENNIENFMNPIENIDNE
jgi:predicted small metal-binding protein